VTGKGHGKKVSAVDGSTTGGPLASAGWDDHIRWALQSGSLDYAGEAKLNGQPAGVKIGKIDPSLMVVACAKGTVVIKDGQVRPSERGSELCVCV
jgi:hypothetical protein